MSAKRPRPAAAGLPLLEPRDSSEWRAWLREHHTTSPGVWLAVGKKGNSRTRLTYEQAVEEAVAFGWIDSTVNRLDEDRFKQLYTPRRPGGNWAASNKARVERLLAEGRMQPAGSAVVEAAKADGSWGQLDDVEALVVPGDLEAELVEEPEAARYWEELPASQRKQLLYWIASAKRPETRANRIARVIAACAEGRRLV